MRALLLIIGLILTIGGIAIGAMSFHSPGDVILGLNLGLGATLMVGGLTIIALSQVIAAIEQLTESSQSFASASAPRQRTEPVVAGAATAAAGAAAGLAAASAQASDTAVERSGEAASAAADEVETAVRKAVTIDEIAVAKTSDGDVAVAETSVAKVEDAVEKLAEKTAVAEVAEPSVTERVRGVVEDVNAAAREAASSVGEPAAEGRYRGR